MDGEGNKTDERNENKTNNEGKGTGREQSVNETTQQNGGQNVDVEKVKADAVKEYLEKFGYDDETLSGIVTKHKEDEDKNSTDLEKSNRLLEKATRELAEERNMRKLAEAKLAAIKLGAKKDLVDDLVTVAMSRVTKDKSVDAVISEMKSGPTGSVYFESEGEDENKNKDKNLTGGTNRNNGNGNGNGNADDDFMKRMKEQRAKSGKSHYFKN